MIQWISEYPIFASILALGLLSLSFGAVLGFAAVKFRVEGDPLVEQIDALLPQTQCGQCGHPGCRPYAQSIAAGTEDINKCPPGGQTTINELANLLDVEAPSLDEEHGEESEVKKIAFIREEDCIGCTKCIQACPVDAILGSAKHTHTVIVSECTGCDLCIEPCPTDCIDLLPVQPTLGGWHWQQPGTHNLIATDREAPSLGNPDEDKDSGQAA